MIRRYAPALLLFLLLLPSLACGEDSGLAPRMKADGSKWRIAYMEGGRYPDFRLTLEAALEGLEQLGWLRVDIPKDMGPGVDHQAFWQWLAANVQSDYVELVADAFFSPGDFESTARNEARQRALTRLNAGDIDLALAMGTWAGQDLATDEHSVPVVVGASSDPEGADIVPPSGDGGLEHVFAVVEPGSFERQVRLFREMADFDRLGLVLEDSPEGRLFAGFDAVQLVAAEQGFEVVPCYAPFNDLPLDESTRRVLACYEELAASVDAVYVTTHRGLTPQALPLALAPLFEKRIPTFSMQGPDEVRRGVLGSLARGGFQHEGRFMAGAIARIFNGARPSSLDMVLESPPTVALNLKTAQIIGYDPPVDILMAADAIYESIAPPEEAGNPAAIR